LNIHQQQTTAAAEVATNELTSSSTVQ